MNLNLLKKLSTTLSNIIYLFLPPIILLIISGIISWFTGDENDFPPLGFIFITSFFFNSVFWYIIQINY